VLTRELVTALPAAQVTATDLNAAMVEFGSRQAPVAAWRQADALSLPFDDQRFDLIICQFGVMFFPDSPPLSARCDGSWRPAAGCCSAPGMPSRRTASPRP
jgi:trans-aconitate methyltransferase